MDNGSYVLWWWQRGEFAEQRGDWQASSCLEIPGADLLQDSSSETALHVTPLGEPPVAFDVRSVYDSRPINAYDFNFSANAIILNGGSTTTFNFNVPQGYRAVPREWEIMLSDPTTATSGFFNTITFNNNNAQVPNNGPVTFGSGGTDGVIKTFFLCEEQTQFGATIVTGALVGATSGDLILNVYGNLIPVTSVALPFSIANETKFDPNIGSH